MQSDYVTGRMTISRPVCPVNKIMEDVVAGVYARAARGQRTRGRGRAAGAAASVAEEIGGMSPREDEDRFVVYPRLIHLHPLVVD